MKVQRKDEQPRGSDLDAASSTQGHNRLLNVNHTVH